MITQLTVFGIMKYQPQKGNDMNTLLFKTLLAGLLPDGSYYGRLYEKSGSVKLSVAEDLTVPLAAGSAPALSSRFE
jgi:hypothetical protein